MRITSKQYTVSIVIPVYNEGERLVGCLESIARQTVKPFEVLVVDNNSTDNTVEVAQRYDFVTVLHEKEQGTIAARNHGFDAARGEIIGRIDGDVILSPQWVARLQQSFRSNQVAAIAGLLETDALLNTHRVRTTFWSRSYLHLSSVFFRVQIMQGGNMAIRKAAWEQIKDDTATDSTYVHEDQDLSVILAAHGLKVLQDNKLRASLPVGDQGHHDWPKLKEYVRRGMQTKYCHDYNETLRRPGAVFFPSRRGLALSCILLAMFGIFAGTSFVASSCRKLKYAITTLD